VKAVAARAAEDILHLLDVEVLDRLACGRPLSADAAALLLTMLANDGRVRITAATFAAR
jgi:hypothetical protein